MAEGGINRRMGMLMVGSAGRNLGKTAVACSIIARFAARVSITAVKVTIADTAEAAEESRLTDRQWIITQQTDPAGDKDTSRMLAAGAERVFWLRTLDSAIPQAYNELSRLIGAEGVVVCESNRLRLVVEPDVFLMVTGPQYSAVKPSAEAVFDYVDRKVICDESGKCIDCDDIDLVGGCWTCRLDAAAIILAGGSSRRMGIEKSMLSVAGKPMIQHIYEQLRPHFVDILIASNDPQRYSFLGVRVVGDDITGQGPLMGIASALAASPCEKNFVIACDIPEIDMDFVRSLVRRIGDCDAIVPTAGTGLQEPLFAVYSKRALPAMKHTLEAGCRRVADALVAMKTRFVDLGERKIVNINTKGDYEQLAGEADNDG